MIFLKSKFIKNYIFETDIYIQYLKLILSMKDTPINFEIASKKIKESGIPSVGKASIREIKKLIDNIEAETGDKYIRMEMGVPGLPPTQIGVEAEIEALRKGVAAIYPDIFGIAPLKPEIFKIRSRC